MPENEMEKTKKWWKSKTIITAASLGGVNLVIAFLTMIQSGNIDWRGFGVVAASILLVFFRKVANRIVE